MPVLHLTDAVTSPILWHRGEYIRLSRDLLGPLAVAQPYTDRTPVLTDGNLESSWASEDASVEHWVEVHFRSLATVSRVVLHWPESQGRFCASKRYRVEGNTGDRWEVLVESAPTSARPWTVHDLNHPAKLSGLRVVQPPGGGSLDHPNRLWLSEIECQ